MKDTTKAALVGWACNVTFTVVFLWLLLSSFHFLWAVLWLLAGPRVTKARGTDDGKDDVTVRLNVAGKKAEVSSKLPFSSHGASQN